jgi:hypothetical protein
MPWARSSDRGIWIGLGWAAVISLIAVCAVWRYKTVWTNGASTKQVLSQASVMIGTFITLYTVFIGGFGALAAFVTKARGHSLRPPRVVIRKPLRFMPR